MEKMPDGETLVRMDDFKSESNHVLHSGEDRGVGARLLELGRLEHLPAEDLRVDDGGHDIVRVQLNRRGDAAYRGVFEVG